MPDGLKPEMQTPADKRGGASKVQKISKQMKRQVLCHWIAIASVLLSLLLLQSCRETPEARFARFMKSGESLMAKKDPARAALEFRNAVQVRPQDPKSMFALAQALVAMGDYRQGVTALRKTLELDPKHIGAQIELSRLKVASSDRDLMNEAQTDLRGVLAADGSNPDALQVLALSELKLGSPADAAKHLEEALTHAPQNLVIAATLAQAKLYEKDVAGAEDVLKKAVAASPNSSDAALVMARFYVALKRYPEAFSQYDRAISLDAKNEQALLGLASLQNATAKKADAEQTLRKLAAFPDADAKSYLPLFLFESGRQAEAVKDFEAIAKEFPGNRQVRTRLVAAYQASNRVEDAKKVLGDALAKNPKDADALIQRAELLVADGKFDQAENDLNRVLRDHADSPEYHYTVARLYKARGADGRYRDELSKVLDLNKFFEPARVDLANSYITIKQPKAAIAVLDQAPESQKGDLSLLVQRNWADWEMQDMAAMRKGIDQGLAAQRSSDLLIQDGLWKLRTGNAAGARASLEEALKMRPDDLQAIDGIRESYVAQHQLPAAIARVKELAAAQPKSAKVQEFLGTLLLIHGTPAEARAALEAAKADDPQDPTADMRLTQLAISQSKWDDAEKSLNAVLSHKENSLARLWLGNVLEIKGNHAGALEQFRKAVADDPRNLDALNNLAYLLLTQAHDNDQALKYAEQAVEGNPNDVDSNDTLGWILYHKGSYTMAIKHLELASKGPNAVSKYHLAMAYAKAGSMPRAKTVLAAALKQNPALPEALEARQLVK